MSGTADFLVEIGTEELPPKSLTALEQAFVTGIQAGLADAGLGSASCRSFATPRRLAVVLTGLALEQAPQKLEKRGPPLAVAFGPDGLPGKAAVAFAAGCGVPVDELGRLETPKGAWLFYSAVVPGRSAAVLLPEIVKAALATLPIPRRMRWGNGSAEFVRPVHWVVMLLGDDVLGEPILGLTPGRTTRGHRFHSPGLITIPQPTDYPILLEESGMVVADFGARRTRVRAGAEAAASAEGGQVQIAPDLLDEVTALVEWPVAITGRFPDEFLRLPTEVLVATLQGHQRYFPVRDSGGSLLPRFVTTANLESRDPVQVRLGNERVILPRLKDAAFFFDQDRQTTLASRVGRLDTVVFQQGLGSLGERAQRVAALSGVVAEALGRDPALVARAAQLAKADLLTQMVGEFPELQGRMGFHYATHDGEPAGVAAAIEEQYLPRFAGDALPRTPDGQVLSVADRLDTLAGIFALGKRPSGNKDPFGLRRSALGLLRILIEDRVDVDLRDLLVVAIRLQPVKGADGETLADELYDFILDRGRAWYLEGLAPGLEAGDITSETFEAVRARRPASLLDFHERLIGMRAFMVLPEAASLAGANKRIANILRSATVASTAVDPRLFADDAERALHAAVERVAGNHGRFLAERNYRQALQALAALKAPVDAFFDAVLVMAEDPAVRQNRLGLLQRLRALFLDVADLSLISST